MTPTQRTALLSIVVSLATILLKTGAWLLTGSVSLLSDAAESLVNLVAATVAFWVLIVVARPADEGHSYGHDKAEYFSSGLEGLLILVAALSILFAAVDRLLHPEPITDLGIGLLVALLAAALNFATARHMLGVAKAHDSITLEADARHLFTDVWTSVGIVAGLAVVLFLPPRWQVLDPLMALLVALNIVRTGAGLLRRSLDGLMDASLPPAERERIEAVIRAQLPPAARYHALRTRKSGAHRFIEFHLEMPARTPVGDAHCLCDRIEEAIGRALPNSSVTIHVEPVGQRD